MTTLLVLIAIAAGAVGIVLLTRMIGRDGLGHDDPPRSHYDELDPRPSERLAHAAR